MRLSRNELLVHINPYVALNHDGMPVGVVFYDPLEGRQGEAHFIGARIAKREVRRPPVPAKRGRAVRRDRRAPLYATRVEHDMTPQRVPHTAHHIAAIESGSLIPANEATAKIAKVPFVDPAARLTAARETAITTWTREYGTPPPVDQWPVLAIAAVPVAQASAGAAAPVQGATTGSAPVAAVIPSAAAPPAQGPVAPSAPTAAPGPAPIPAAAPPPTAAPTATPSTAVAPGPGPTIPPR